MGRRKKGQAISGWLVIDKPSGPTSSDVVNRVRRLYDARKAGHGGTLDPTATGILPIALGEATKTLPYIADARKRYRFTLKWGTATTTDDAEGPPVETSPNRPRKAEIEACLPSFLGVIDQVPPRFSAIKIAGRRAYEMARAEEHFEIAARPVEIHELTLARLGDDDHASFEVSCGKGTYMRALARDLGAALGTRAHITELRRLSVGPFAESGAISLDKLESLGHSPAAFEQLLPIEAALDDIPALSLAPTEASRIRCGQAVSLMARIYRERIAEWRDGETIFVTSGGKPVALMRYTAGELHPVRVLNL